MANFRRLNFRALTLGVSLFALAACEGGLDIDLRDVAGGFDTSSAAQTPTEARPNPDNLGIIRYPNFDVAIAKRGDTLTTVANRVGVNADELARYNGIDAGATLRKGEVIALPNRVSGGTGVDTEPLQPSEEIDISVIAGGALDRAEQNKPTTPFQTKPAPVQTGVEPIQHKVARGETAYSISRLYGVSVRSLGEWNGLGSALTVREGQYLLIPVAKTATRTPKPVAETSVPGEGTATPTPPSASAPLPEETLPAPEVETKPEKPNLAEERTAASGTAKLLQPVNGSIIRGYEKGKTDGIDIAASAGTAVKAADDGIVAAITRNTDGVPILVLRHPGNLLTVYANIDNVKFAKGDKVTRGQAIAEVRGASPSFLHFEVRDGFDSVDPVPYLN